MQRHNIYGMNRTHALSHNLAIALAYFVLAFAAQRLTHTQHVLSFWPASGVASFAAMYLDWLGAPGLFIGTALASFYLDGFSADKAVWLGLGNTLAPLLAFHLMKRLRGGWSGFTSIPNTVAFIVIMGGLNGVLAAAWASQVGLSRMGSIHWLVNDALSTIMFTPVFYLWATEPTVFDKRMAWRQTLLLALLTWAATVWLFFQPYQENSLVLGASALLLLPLIIAALRLSLKSAVTISAVAFLIATVATTHGLGPYHMQQLLYPLALLQIVGFSSMVAVLITAVLTQEREIALQNMYAVNLAFERRVLERTKELLESREQERLRKQYFEMLSDANRLFANSTETGLPSVLLRFTDLLVQHLGLQLAWVGIVPTHSRSVSFLARSGPLSEVLDAIHISVDESLPEGRGPTANVLRTGEIALFDITDPHYAAWHALIAHLDVGGSANVPIRWTGNMQGVMALYHKKGERFPPYIIDLLSRLAEDLAIFLRQQQLAQELIHARKLKNALIAVGDTAFTTNNEARLLQRTCEQLIGSDLFVAAWIAKPDHNNYFQHLASSGVGAPDASIFNLKWSALENEPTGQTLTARAWRADQIQVLQDYINDPQVASWRELALKNQWRAIAAIPVLRQHVKWAMLTVIGDQPDLFTEEMQQILMQVAQLLGHALDEIDLKQALIQERTLQSHLANHDALTGLANRRGLHLYLSNSLDRALRHDKLHALAVLDLDNFKPVNDTYGHAAGDELLKLFAKRLQNTVRKSDFIARLGGDEFVLVFEDLDDFGQLEQLLVKLNDAIMLPFQPMPLVLVQIEASMGISLFPTDNAEADLVLRHADRALYQIKSKKGHRNRNWAIHQMDNGAL